MADAVVMIDAGEVPAASAPAATGPGRSDLWDIQPTLRKKGNA